MSHKEIKRDSSPLKALVSRRRLLVGAGATSIALTGADLIFRPPPAAAAQEDDWQAQAGADWKKVLEAAQKEGTLVLGGPGPAGEALVQGFKRDTGISVQWLGGAPFEHTARLGTELRTGNVTIDVLIGGMAELAFIDQLKPLDDQLLLPQVSDGKLWRAGHIKYNDDTRRYIAQGTEYASGWLVVNSTAVTETDIKVWKDLLDPKCKGRIGSISPLLPSSGQSLARFLMDHFGSDFVRDLFLGQQVAYTNDYDLLIEWVARKKYDIVLGAVQANLEKFRSQGFQDVIKTVMPSDVPGYSSGGFSLIKMPKGMPHPNSATVFLNWYLSKPGAAAYCPAMLEPSRRTDVAFAQLDYLVPKSGVTYDDTYDEQSYRRGPSQIATLKSLLER